jgi:hypothetical protein
MYLICKDMYISVDVSVGEVRDKVVYVSQLETHKKGFTSGFFWMLVLDRMLHVFSLSQNVKFCIFTFCPFLWNVVCLAVIVSRQGLVLLSQIICIDRLLSHSGCWRRECNRLVFQACYMLPQL